MPCVEFVGTGEAFDPALPNTSILYRGGRTLLLDCGYAVPHALWRLDADPDLLDAVYVTHRHADHAFGLPGLLLGMRFRGRRRPLDLIGGPGVAGWLETLLELAYPGAWDPPACYPIRPRPLAPGDRMELGPVVLRNAPSRHGVRNLAVRLDEAGAAVAYSGDGAPTEATAALFRGAGLVIHECYSAAPVAGGHADLETLEALATDLGLPHLAVLHLSVPEKEAIRARARAWRAPTRLSLPAPGDRFELSPPTPGDRSRSGPRGGGTPGS